MSARLLLLDRIEERIAVMTDAEGNVFECPSELLLGSSAEGTAFTAKLENGKITELTAVDNPNAGVNASRLRKLFERHRG